MGLAGKARSQLKETARSLVAKAPRAAQLPPATWSLEDGPKGLALRGVPLADLAAEHGSPLHVVDVAKLQDNARRFQAVPAGRAAGAEVYASYKTSPIPGVLGVLHRAGIGAEVISHYELWLALRLGVAPERILFNGPVKSAASIRLAIDRGLGLIAANHPEELAEFARHAQAAGKRPRVAVRVSTSQGWTAQFGAPIASGAALRACQEALERPELELVGLHSHRGGMIRSQGELERFVDEVLAFTSTLADATKFVPQVLDLGGSLGTQTVAPLGDVDRRLNRTFFRELPVPQPEAALSIDGYLSMLLEKVESHFAQKGWPRPRVMLEPGRAMTGNAQLMLGRVHSIKDDGDRSYAILDAGINHAEAVRNEYHQLFPVVGHDRQPGRVYTVVGPICTPGDWLYQAVRLPELVPGELLAVMDAGAYFVPFATSFSFPQPAIVGVENGQATLWRRAETFEDQVALDVVG